MDDENKQEDVVQEPPKPSPMVEAAQLAAENLIKENERLEKNLSKLYKQNGHLVEGQMLVRSLLRKSPMKTMLSEC